MYWEYYIMGVILIPGIIIASVAQARVSSTFGKYNQVFASSGVTTLQLISHMLAAAGLNHISIIQVPGHLSDHYDSKKKVLALSGDTYNSSSIAALGVACHEFGHALQDSSNYAPLKIRKILIPLSNIASTLLWPLVIIGLVFNFAVVDGAILGNIFLWSGIAVFGSAVLVNLITLPVEYNASNRAIKLLRETGTLNEEELEGAKKVLNAAALTYVAALLVSMLNLIRFAIVILSAKNRD